MKCSPSPLGEAVCKSLLVQTQLQQCRKEFQKDERGHHLEDDISSVAKVLQSIPSFSTPCTTLHL